MASQTVAQTFANREGLSSATIRNVMASLADAGLLEQPHTSAGRVPTAAAFRYYVEQIVQPVRASFGGQGEGASPVILPINLLSEQRREQIEDSFSGVSSTNEYLERTAKVLALLSSGLGVALASTTGTQILEHIHFSRLGQCARPGRHGHPGRRCAGSRPLARSRRYSARSGYRRPLSE